MNEVACSPKWHQGIQPCCLFLPEDEGEGGEPALRCRCKVHGGMTGRGSCTGRGRRGGRQKAGGKDSRQSAYRRECKAGRRRRGVQAEESEKQQHRGERVSEEGVGAPTPSRLFVLPRLPGFLDRSELRVLPPDRPRRLSHETGEGTAAPAQ